MVLELLLDVLEMLLELLDLSWRSWTWPEGPSTGPKAPTGWFISNFSKFVVSVFLETLKSYSIFNTTVRLLVKFYIRLVGLTGL